MAGGASRADRDRGDVGERDRPVLDQHEVKPVAVLDPADAAHHVRPRQRGGDVGHAEAERLQPAGIDVDRDLARRAAEYVDARRRRGRGREPGRICSSAIWRSATGSRLGEVSASPSTGKMVGSDRRTLKRVPAGKSGRIVASAPWVASFAATMSSPQPKLSADLGRAAAGGRADPGDARHFAQARSRPAG